MPTGCLAFALPLQYRRYFTTKAAFVNYFHQKGCIKLVLLRLCFICRLSSARAQCVPMSVGNAGACAKATTGHRKWLGPSKGVDVGDSESPTSVTASPRHLLPAGEGLGTGETPPLSLFLTDKHRNIQSLHTAILLPQHKEIHLRGK